MRLSRVTAVTAVIALLPLPAVGALASPSRVSAAPRHRLQIVVTNDDGYRAPGIAAISSALATLPDVHVTVVAPATDESGTGGSTTKGRLRVTRGTTANGLPAYAVHGYPADTVRVALNRLHLHPDLVVSGINAGQNLGPVIDLSGTVGAARAAVARGIPAIAVSSGFGSPIRFRAAVPFVLRWVRHHRAALAAGHAIVHVVSFNVPTCAKGAVRGRVWRRPDLRADDIGKALGSSRCTSKARPGKTDVSAFAVGFAVASVLPAKPASTG